MVDERADAALWLEATSGTERSFAVLFDRYRRRVFRKAYAQLKSVHDAEDVVAIVFLEAWRNRAKVRIVDGSILPWLLSVTSYVLLNHARSARRWNRLLAALPEPEQHADHADIVLDRLDHDAELRAVYEAMAVLTAQERSIIDLSVIEELPLATVAAVLDIPVGTVKSKLHRAREKIRRRMPSHLTNDTRSELTARLYGAAQ
ncbi:sigma-70 family RNA polymerase sigma factor [Leifsonia sp. F6_8S_P_1B]|uniref:Sigma-70 family RNA polymerase sigma factor n=1 Tax=Leifsonia williamsii TaxID=3035919 RepID=A0ABT8K629_9MICO|nr:sigma-70 family RNA polymerase sigma factor [Leifsonia williamsii]MDN4612918.1 sigma-70 family RNA polymerase sigma factor [Leifsonia williamsii]